MKLKNMKIFLKKQNIIIIIAFGLFFPFKGAHAKGFAVTPSIVETSVRKQQVEMGTFTIVNKEDYTVTVEVTLENWLKKKGYKNKISDLEPGEWLSIKPERFEIKPNSRKYVNYFISAPEGIKGELVAMAYFAPKAKGKESFLRTRFGVCVYAAIKKTEKVKCKIIETKITENKETGDMTFSVKVENKGNVHVRPVVKLKINKKKKEIKRIVFYTGNSIFPGKTHTYVETWKKADLAQGVYKARAEMRYGKVFGKSKFKKGKKVKIIKLKQAEAEENN